MSQAVLNYLLLDTKKEASDASSYMKVSLFLFEEKRIWLPTTDSIAPTIPNYKTF
jgi:hypothetical protein